MIRKVILTALILFFGYNLYLNWYPAAPSNPALAYWVKENHTKAQFYLNEQANPRVVLCGTSLSSLMTLWLPDSVYDLSIVGGSALTGVELVKKSGKIPGALGVELNFLLRTEDPYINEDALHPIWNPIRKYLPAFNAYHQPADILTAAWQKHQMRLQVLSVPPSSPNPRQSTYDANIGLRKADYAELPDSALCVEMRDYLYGILNEMQAKGCRPFFYLMPMDTALLHSNRIRAYLNYFQNSPFPIILPDTTFNWKTADGEHLLPVYGLLFSRQLTQAIAQRP